MSAFRKLQRGFREMHNVTDFQDLSFLCRCLSVELLHTTTALMHVFKTYKLYLRKDFWHLKGALLCLCGYKYLLSLNNQQ